MRENFLTADVLTSAKVTQADFARILGVTKTRINQLVRDGLLTLDDDGGLPVVKSLKDFWTYRVERRHYEITPTEFHERFATKYDPKK